MNLNDLEAKARAALANPDLAGGEFPSLDRMRMAAACSPELVLAMIQVCRAAEGYVDSVEDFEVEEKRTVVWGKADTDLRQALAHLKEQDE